MKNLLLTLIGSCFLFLACTDLEVEEFDSILIEDEEGAFTGVANVEGSITEAFNQIANIGSQDNTYALMEVTSDAQLVPTRGTDWGDNGVWRTLHQHTWDASHQYVLNVWNQRNSAVFGLTQVIDSRSNPTAEQEGQARFLRALNMMYVLDFWGQVPFRDLDAPGDEAPQVFTRQEAVDFIQNDLELALDNLPDLAAPGTDEQLLRGSKAACNLLIAKFYLNKHIFLGNDPGSTPAAADMDRVIEAVDDITAAGFVFEEDYFQIFDPAPDNETLFIINSDAGTKIWNTLHYAHDEFGQGGGWNGFTTTAEFYALFEGPASNVQGSGQEERRGFVPNEGYGFGFLIGQQYDYDGNPLTTRGGAPLAFTAELPGLAGNTEETGIRLLKYHPDNGGAFPSRQIVFRYSDAWLMKAEAHLWKGETTEALGMVNTLRGIRGASDLAALTPQEMLNERGRELYMEGWRRQDQIRFGAFTQAWAYKDNTEDFRVLFPLPVLAVSTNPNLVQNPGY